MKMKKLFAICLVALSALISVHLQAQEVETLVLIDTDMGKIKVKLFNDTPQHRDNFIKNVKEHLYDGLLFHRVIKQFMVQAGDINSKDAPLEQHLGDGDLDYTIPAEIVYPKYFHKRGMFAAARTGDEENPERASSATQFYISTRWRRNKASPSLPNSGKPICWKAVRLIWTVNTRSSAKS